MIKLKKYKISICYEEGVVLYINETNKHDAEIQAEHLAGEMAGSNYPNKYEQETVHRDYFINDVEEIK